MSEAVEAKLLSVAEAARALGMSRRAFDRARRVRGCACYRFGGARATPRFAMADLVAWREGFRVEPEGTRAAAPRGVRGGARIVALLNSLDSRAPRGQNVGENGTLRPIAGKEM